MPKETVRSTEWPEQAGADPGYRDEVTVNWSNFTDGWLQVATIRAEPVESSPDAPAHFGHSNGLYVNLDRNGVNRLIRALRKARDRAFGADA